jgi:hypothetical protein
MSLAIKVGIAIRQLRSCKQKVCDHQVEIKLSHPLLVGIVAIFTPYKTKRVKKDEFDYVADKGTRRPPAELLAMATSLMCDCAASKVVLRIDHVPTEPFRTGGYTPRIEIRESREIVSAIMDDESAK